jgi:tetratricopeptide (TPR) repeat protein
MASNRLQGLLAMLAQNPSDSFARYGVAMEYASAGELEKAVEEFRVLLAANPNYPAAYYHAGRALERLGRTEEAREVYRKGVEITTHLGDLHTRSELEAALDLL